MQITESQISKFGGDPKKVTIWGESAGAGSVLQQVVANGGKTNPPLFRAAIASSTFLPSQYKYNDRISAVGGRCGADEELEAVGAVSRRAAMGHGA